MNKNNLKPSHYLAAFLWLNFSLALWGALLKIIDLNLKNALIIILIFILAVFCSAIAGTKK